MHPRVEAKEGNTESIGGGYNNNNNNGQVGIDKRRPRKSFLTDRGGGSKYRKEKLVEQGLSFSSFFLNSKVVARSNGMQMSERFDRTRLNDPRGGLRGRGGGKGVGEIRFEPIGAHPVPVSIGGEGTAAGRAGREGSVVAIERRTPRALLSLSLSRRMRTAS